MRALFYSVILSLITIHGNAALATQFHSIDTHVDFNLKRARAMAESAAASNIYGTCGSVLSVKIDEKSPNTKWEKVVKEVLSGPYINRVSARHVKRTGPDHTYVEQDIVRTIQHLGSGTDDIDDSNAALTEEVRHFLVESTEGREGELMVGSLDGEFSLRRQFIAIIDHNADEILIFGDGYCE